MYNRSGQARQVSACGLPVVLFTTFVCVALDALHMQQMLFHKRFKCLACHVWTLLYRPYFPKQADEFTASLLLLDYNCRNLKSFEMQHVAAQAMAG